MASATHHSLQAVPFKTLPLWGLCVEHTLQGQGTGVGVGQETLDPWGLLTGQPELMSSYQPPPTKEHAHPEPTT